MNVGDIQGYHHEEDLWNSDNESYAFDGFKVRGYFNSDRMEKTAIIDGKLVRLDTHGNLKVDPLLAYGLEVEIECDGINAPKALSAIMEKVIFPNFKFGDKMFKMQHDGSLRGNTSVEVITQPMTMGRIRNDYAAWKAMYEYMELFDMSADSFSTSCGMHVNLSNALFGKTEDEQKDNLRKLYFLINNRYKFFRTLFWRSQYATTWCQRMTADNVRNYMMDWSDPADLPDKLDFHNAKSLDFDYVTSSHHACLNYSHFNAGRIEIRLVGGQPDFRRFRETMECIFHIVAKLPELDWDDLDDLVKVFTGCNQYVLSRLSNCVFDRGLTAEDYGKLDRACKRANFEIR